MKKLMTGAVPATVRKAPVTDTSKPFGSLVALAQGPMGAFMNAQEQFELFQAAGYVEEEWILSGIGDVYGPGGVISAKDAPYATRILVRRPADPGRFSGTVQIEPFASMFEGAITWGMAARYILRNGDAWIGLSGSAGAGVADDGSAVGGVAILRRADPERYGSLVLESSDPEEWPALRGRDLPELLKTINWLGEDPTGARAAASEEFARTNSHGYSVMAQLGRLLKSNSPDSPLNGLTVERLFASGASHTGQYWKLFLGDGHHEAARMPDGSAVFDGYMINVAHEPDVFPDDAVIACMLSEYETRDALLGLQARRDDSDKPRFRRYEVPGTGHAMDGLPEAGDLPVPQGRVAVTRLAGGRPVEDAAAHPRHSDRLHTPLIYAVMRNMEAWVRDGTPMPHADRIGHDPGAEDGVLRDQHGNAVGGIRTPWVEAPNARYGNSCPAHPLAPTMAPFTEDKMTALYGSRDEYEARFRAQVRALVDARLLLPDDADRFRP